MPLHWAAENTFDGAPSIVAVLLDAGANPGAKTAAGESPWDLGKDNTALKGTAVYWRFYFKRLW